MKWFKRKEKVFKKIWDIRSKGIDRWEVFCLLHGEVDTGFTSVAAAISRAEYYNQYENGELTRTRHGHDQMDNPYSHTEKWCHGCNLQGYEIAGWYEPTSWVKQHWTYVGERL